MKISKETIVGTALSLLALTNSILTMSGISPLPIDDELVTNLISSIFLIATSAYTWWHNNSISKSATMADEVMKALKEKRITEEQVQAMISGEK